MDLDAQLIDLAAGLGDRITWKPSSLKNTAQKGKSSYMFSTRGNPHRAAEGLVGCQRLVIEDPVIFIGIKIRDIPFGFSFPRPRSQRLPEIYCLPPVKAVDGQTQWLTQPRHRLMVVV